MSDLTKTRDYTSEQITDARKLMDLLKKIPRKELQTGRLLTIGFMNGLDAAQLAAGNKQN